MPTPKKSYLFSYVICDLEWQTWGNVGPTVGSVY